MVNPAMLAQCYMNPYINTAVQQMSDIGQRNIQRNLSPQATAAAVGSGQFGSQRGAQVLGQVQSDAQRDLDSQISQMLSSGYGQALQAAGQKNALLGQLGQTAGSLQQQQAGVLGQLGSTAGSLAGQKAQTLNQAGQTIGQLGTAGQNANLACINALATLGGQQQTIGQNEQLFPMSTLSQLSQLLQGYNIPVSTKTTLCRSGIENIGSIAGLLGNATQKNPLTGESLVGAGKSLTDKILGRIFGSTGNAPTAGSTGSSYNWCPNRWGCTGNVISGEGNGYWCGVTGDWVPNGAKGGLVSTNAIGCASTQYRGALPKE
jgi:hypothetical protein